MKHRPSTIKPIHEVVDAVKADIARFGTQPVSFNQPASPNQVCGDKSETNKIFVSLQSIKLTLKTVRGSEYAPSAGLVAPLGILSIDPSYSGTYLRSGAHGLEINLNPATLQTNSPSNMPPADGASLYGTIEDMAKELLAVDRTKGPCLVPTTVKSTVFFDVVDKGTAGVGIKVLGFKLGSKTTTIDEYHQALEVAFKMDGSTPMAPTLTN
jgi:hypothetical protein